MNYQIVLKLVQSVITAIENSAIATNKTLRQTLSVKVTNPIKKVDVKGQVVVSNLKNLDKPLKQLREATLAVKSSIEDIPTEITVKNFPTKIEVSNPPVDQTDKVVNAVAELAKKVQALHKDSLNNDVRVTNQPTSELLKVEKAVNEVSKRLSQIKLDPKITVQAPKPERVIVPPAQVTVDKTEIDYKKLAKEVSAVTKDFDYKRLAKILVDEISGIVVTGGGGGGASFRDSNGDSARALVDDQGRLVTATTAVSEYSFCDKTEVDGVQHIGYATNTGAWKIKKYDGDSMRYASGDSDYETNWTNRASLVYDYPYA
jgi:hypothetical protein